MWALFGRYVNRYEILSFEARPRADDHPALSLYRAWAIARTDVDSFFL